MAGKSKTELEREFWEKWKVKIFNLFKKKEKREQIETEEKEGYIQFIFDFTEIHGVRETARKLEDQGFKINPSDLSQIRNGTPRYNVSIHYLASIAEAISNLSAVTEGKDEKK